MPQPGFRSSVGVGARRLLLLAPVCLLMLGLAVRGPAPVFTYLFGFIGTGMLLVLVLVLSTQDVFAVDTTRRHYHSTRSTLGMGSPEWKPLPAVSAVVVKHFSQYEVRGRSRLRSERPVRYYIVLLSVAGSATGIVVRKLSHGQQGEARQLTAQLAAYLGVPQRLFEEPAEAH